MSDGEAKPLIKMIEGVKILYKDAIDKLLFLKRQQWAITNYALVVYATVVAISRGASIHEKWMLSLIAFAAWAYGVWCIVHTQRSMTEARSRLFQIYENYFHPEERTAFEMWKIKPTFHHAPEFFYGLIVAHVIAVALAIYLIWRGVPSWPAT